MARDLISRCSILVMRFSHRLGWCDQAFCPKLAPTASSPCRAITNAPRDRNPIGSNCANSLTSALISATHALSIRLSLLHGHACVAPYSDYQDGLPRKTCACQASTSQCVHLWQLPRCQTISAALRTFTKKQTCKSQFDSRNGSHRYRHTSNPSDQKVGWRRRLCGRLTTHFSVFCRRCAACSARRYSQDRLPTNAFVTCILARCRRERTAFSTDHSRAFEEWLQSHCRHATSPRTRSKLHLCQCSQAEC